MLDNISLTSIFYTAGKTAGLLSFVSLSLLIISGDMARFFDRYFGLDAIIKFQRKFATLITVFVLSHPIFFMLSSGSILDYLIPDFSILPFAMGIVSFYIFLVIIIASKLYKKISHNTWQYLHVLTYILFFFALYHAFNWGSDADKIYIKGTYYLLLTGVIIGIVFRTQYKIRKLFAGKFRVESVRQETHDTYTIRIKPDKKVNFKAGQFGFIRLTKDKLHARHPFTISSSPDKDYLDFTIKREGIFTQASHKLSPGESIKLDIPFGKFLIKDNKKDLVFIAGGVGITPFMSMIDDHAYKNKNQKITLLYGCRKENDIIFKDRLDNISKDWLKKIYILSQEDKPISSREKGYIDQGIIEKHVGNIDNSLFYICGPETMKNSVTKILKKLGVKNKDIIIEDFFW
jgi:predicted ferric reductase